MFIQYIHIIYVCCMFISSVTHHAERAALFSSFFTFSGRNLSEVDGFLCFFVFLVSVVVVVVFLCMTPIIILGYYVALPVCVTPAGARRR